MPSSQQPVATEKIHRIELPWGAWYQDVVHPISLPGDWIVDLLQPRDAPSCSSDDIVDACSSPVDSPPLSELAKGKKTACVVVDDLARPTKAAEVLPCLLQQLDDRVVRSQLGMGLRGDQHGLAWFYDLDDCLDNVL